MFPATATATAEALYNWLVLRGQRPSTGFTPNINPTSVTKDLCGFLGLFRDYALFGKECSLGDGVQHAMQVNNTGFCGAWSRLEVYRKTGLRSTCNMVNA